MPYIVSEDDGLPSIVLEGLWIFKLKVLARLLPCFEAFNV